MMFAELLAHLETTQPLRVVDVAASLLRFCRAHLGRLRNEVEGFELNARLATLRRQAAERFGPLSALRFDELLPEDCADARRWLAEWAGASTERIAARACVLGLDDAFGSRFAWTFRDLGEVEVGEAAPFPIAPVDLKAVFGRLGTNPETIDCPVDRTRHLALVPAVAGIAVVLSCQHGDVLAPLARGARLAAACPNTPLEHLEWDPPAGDTFYNVRPRAERREPHAARVLSLLARSCEAADVVVFPELLVDEGLLASVRAELAARAASGLDGPLLVVAGSRHVHAPAGVPGANEAVGILRSMGEVLHRKFKPFVHEGLRERIDTAAPRVRVLASGDWSAAILICKDILDQEVSKLLIALQVRLILVPSMSTSTEEFVTVARNLGLRAQATVVIANAQGLATTAADAVFGHPTRAQATVVPRGRVPPCTSSRSAGTWRPSRCWAESLRVPCAEVA